MKLIKNALIPDLKSNTFTNKFILFSDKIEDISNQKPFAVVTEEIDLKNKILLPGAIDAHVHFNEPGFESHEDFTTGSKAAAAGGITTVVDMPCTSIPPVTTVENLNVKLKIIKKNSLIDFALWGGVRGNDFPNVNSNIDSLWQAGVVGFKIYTISGMDTFESISYDNIAEILQSNPQKLFAFHAEDAGIIKRNAKENYKWSEYSEIRSVEAEVTAVSNIIQRAGASPIHFVHISSKSAAQHIISAKTIHNVTWETCPHYLAFTSNDFQNLRGRLKTAPPVKFKEDQIFLNEALVDGTLDYVTTDHAGCNFEKEKNLEDFSKIYNGIPGTQLLLPFLASSYLINEKISPRHFTELTSTNPAKRLGLYPLKGSLKIGTDADFSVIDQNRSFVVNESALYSKGKYSPFVGQSLTCSIDSTIVRGATVFHHKLGFMADPGYGNWIKRIKL